MTNPESAVDKTMTCKEMQEVDWDSGSRNHRDVVFAGGNNHPNFKQITDCHNIYSTTHGDIGFPSGNGTKESSGFKKWDQSTNLKDWIHKNFLP